ncbi:Amino-acid acetyltransferase, mitochondrial [Hypoxylon texense]
MKEVPGEESEDGSKSIPPASFSIISTWTQKKQPQTVPAWQTPTLQRAVLQESLRALPMERRNAMAKSR